MSEAKQRLGELGEQLSADFLTKMGYTVLNRRFRVKGGEIDIVALDGETLVFIEVKARKSASYAQPREAVNFKKRAALTRAAEEYLLRTGCERACRFDVIEIVMDERRITHIQHAFGG